MFSDDTIRFYDAIYADKQYSAEAKQVGELIVAKNPNARELLDVACGTGAHLAEFAALGWHVAGLDLMPGMVEATRRRLAVSAPGTGGENADVQVGDLVDFEFGRTFDAVTCLFSSIGYAASIDGLQRSIACMTRHLRPGGVLVIEPFYPPEMWLEGRIGHDVVELEDLTVIRLARSQRRDDVAIIDFHHAIGTPDRFEYWDEHHELLLASPDAYVRAFESAGLVAEFDEHGFAFRGGGRGLVIGHLP